MTAIDAILQQVLSLSPAERQELGHRLWALQSSSPEHRLWKDEILRRVESVRAGRAELVDADEALSRIEAKLASRGA